MSALSQLLGLILCRAKHLKIFLVLGCSLSTCCISYFAITSNMEGTQAGYFLLFDQLVYLRDMPVAKTLEL